MISRITPEKLAQFSRNSYLAELKQDFLHMRPGEILQFIYVHEYEFAKGGKGALFIIGSNLKAYWQRDELRQLESDHIRDYMYGTVKQLKTDKKDLELNIKRGGIIKSNRPMIVIAFREIFRALGYGNMRISFREAPKSKKGGIAKPVPDKIDDKIRYVQRRPALLRKLRAELEDSGNLPEAELAEVERKLSLAYARNSVEHAALAIHEMETLLLNAQAETD
jgi:hypothetical protein